MDFKISKPTLSDIPAMRNLVLPEVQKGIILDRSEDEMAGVIRSYSVIRVVDSASDNSVLGMQFRTCGNFWASTDSSLVESPKISTNTKATPQSLPLRFCESQNLGENNPRVSANLESRPLRGAKNRIQASSSASADFLLEAEKRGSPSKSEKRSFWRVEGAGRGVQPFLRKESKLSGENSVRVAESKKISRLPRRFCESARNDEFIRDSSLTAQNDKIMDCNADSANLLAMTKNKNFAESALDSAPQDEFGSPSKNPIIAFAALQILSLTLGEVRSLIVDEKYRRKGLATMLIEHLLAEARALNLKEVLALTYQREVFEKLGFKEIAKESLPNQKIWADCIKCKKFPVCDEIALTKIL